MAHLYDHHAEWFSITEPYPVMNSIPKIWASLSKTLKGNVNTCTMCRHTGYVWVSPTPWPMLIWDKNSWGSMPWYLLVPWLRVYITGTIRDTTLCFRHQPSTSEFILPFERCRHEPVASCHSQIVALLPPFARVKDLHITNDTVSTVRYTKRDAITNFTTCLHKDSKTRGALQQKGLFSPSVTFPD